MGKIFSFEEINARAIPKISGFKMVADYVRDGLEKSDVIVGGTLFGSTAWDACTVRSDVDFFVIYKPEYRARAMRMFQEMTSHAAHFYVPLNIISIAADIAKSPLHSIGASFMRHLLHAAEKSGNVKGKNLKDLISSAHFDWKEDERSYFRHKLRKLEEWLCDASVLNEDALLHAITKALGVAVRTARKVLIWHHGPMPDDSAREVYKRYPSIASKDELELFERLIGTDECYNLALPPHIEKPNKEEYNYLIKRLTGVVWDAHEFVRLTALRLTS